MGDLKQRALNFNISAVFWKNDICDKTSNIVILSFTTAFDKY